MSESIQLHTHVWRTRAEIDHVWLTPSPVNCLRYAVTEVGEAMDAWLRSRRPDDARNNERAPDVLDELADCAIMLASALPSDSKLATQYPITDGVDMDTIAGAVARALTCMECNRFHAIEWALACIFAFPGFSLPVALDRLEGIREKMEELTPGQPCKHAGYMSHVSHPCEGCGRIAGQWIRSQANDFSQQGGMSEKDHVLRLTWGVRRHRIEGVTNV